MPELAKSPEDTPPARIESLSAITLATSDMARAVPFYEALGFARSYGGPDAAFTVILHLVLPTLNLIAEMHGPIHGWGPCDHPCVGRRCALP